MARQLTPAVLLKVEARALHAPRGKWGYHLGDNFAVVAVDLEETATGYSYRQYVAHLEGDDFWDNPANEDEDRATEQLTESAEFIAHSRDDVLALVAEVRSLQDELEATRSLLATTRERLDAAVGLGGHQLSRVPEWRKRPAG